MPINTTIESLSLTAALNGPQGSDLPSSADDAIRYALSFIAFLRDGGGRPVGEICQFAGINSPGPNYIKLNGALLNRVTYANLFNWASAQGLVSESVWNSGAFGCFSVGDGATTFRIPDLRAMFTRGLDEGRGLDAGRLWGIYQDQANVSHTHSVFDPQHTHGLNDTGHIHSGSTDFAGTHQHPGGEFPGLNPLGGGTGAHARSAFETQANTGDGGNHQHAIVIQPSGTGISLISAPTNISLFAQGAADGHPRNVAYPWWIKY